MTPKIRIFRQKFDPFDGFDIHFCCECLNSFFRVFREVFWHSVLFKMRTFGSSTVGSQTVHSVLVSRGSPTKLRVRFRRSLYWIGVWVGVSVCVWVSWCIYLFIFFWEKLEVFTEVFFECL